MNDRGADTQAGEFCMADGPSNPEVFDVERIRRLVELMNEYGLTEVNLRHGQERIQLRRGAEPMISGPGAAPGVPVPLPSSSSPPAKASPPPSTEAEPAEEKHVVFIKSPMVGTFYASPDPDSPAYVKVGDAVGPETIVCIVEAMKVFNQIPAEVSGRIVGVLVENGAPVEFGQPMFKVDTRQ